MVLGVAVVVGSFIYSITRLRPLEQKITQRQAELKAAEEEFRALSDKNDELKRDREKAQADLETTRNEVNSALVRLEEIRNSPLPAMCWVLSQVEYTLRPATMPRRRSGTVVGRT